jgi:hypothetical protein
MRRYEEQRSVEGKWETREEVTARYDLPIDRSRFQPPIAVETTVVNGAELLEKWLSLDKALFVKQVMGLVFAVHDIQRCDNGMILVVSSLRPAPETIKSLGPIRSETRGGAVYGGFGLSRSRKRVDGKERYYQPINLGSAYKDGVEIRWSLLHPLGDWPKDTATCELSVYIYALGKLAQQRRQAGEKLRRYGPMTVLPLPDKATRLGKVIGGVYSQAVALAPLAERVCLREAGRHNSGMGLSYRLRRPSEITAEEFGRQVRLEFQRLEAMRQESKRKTEAPKAGG